MYTITQFDDVSKPGRNITSLFCCKFLKFLFIYLSKHPLFNSTMSHVQALNSVNELHQNICKRNIVVPAMRTRQSTKNKSNHNNENQLARLTTLCLQSTVDMLRTCHIVARVTVFAEISLRSSQQSFICIIKKYIYRIKLSKIYEFNFENNFSDSRTYSLQEMWPMQHAFPSLTPDNRLHTSS